MVDLEKTVRKIYKAMTEGDLEFLDQIFDDNMKYIGASNTTHSKEVIMRELPYNKAAFPDESESIEVTQLLLTKSNYLLLTF